MTQKGWRTERLSVASLFLDEKNPRLGRGTRGRSPQEIIQYLFDHDKALDVARSIATRGYFENEPLLAIFEGRHYVVVEGNRRLAAIKALKEPELLTGSIRRKVERLASETNLDTISTVPVTIAPNRRATDRLLSGRHIGTPVLAWEAENRANFILSKLEDGYSKDELHADLGFTEQEIQKARQTRAISEMARALDLPPEVKAKVDNPRVKLLSTLERVFDSSVGRMFLKVEPDEDHGLRGTTTKNEFLRAFTELVTDIALRRQTSRSLNKSENIREYFEQRNPKAIAERKKGQFVPSDITSGGSVTSPKPSKPQRKTRQTDQTVIPRSFKVRFGHERLAAIHGELSILNRDKFANAGAVLLRVFLELAIKDYLERTGRLKGLLAKRRAKGKPSENQAITMRALATEILSVVQNKLTRAQATMVEKALRYDPAAPFSLNDLHAFVHQNDFPVARDIEQFWNRTEPLFRLMLEQAPEDFS